MTTFPSGSFMEYGDIKNYSAEINKAFWIKPSERIEVEGIVYVPTSIIEPQLTVQEWRTMQSKVTTLITYKSIEIL